jgi:hypothetical protein
MAKFQIPSQHFPAGAKGNWGRIADFEPSTSQIRNRNATRYSVKFFIDWIIRNTYSVLLANEFNPVAFIDRTNKAISNWNLFPVAAN